MSEVSMSEILSLILSVFIHAVLLIVAYHIGYQDGWEKGYMDDKDFEKTVRDTFRVARIIQMNHTHGGDAHDL